MTRVLHVVLNPVINDSRVLKEAESLGRHDYQVTILGVQNDRGDLPTSEGFPFFKIHRIRLSTKQLPKIRFVQYIKYMEYLYRALLFVRQYSPEIIHCHDLNTLPVGVFSLAKLIYDTHEFERGRNGLTRWGKILNGLMENLLTKKAHIIIAVNQDIASRLGSILGRNVSWILNADRKKTIAEVRAEKGITLREQLSIPQHQKIVIYPGRLTEGRGLINILKMAPHLRNSVVVIMGNGPLLPRLQKMIERDHLLGSVFLLPPVPYHEVSRYISTSDLGIMPTENTSESYFLSLGNKIFHYIAAGIPVAVSDQPAKRRIVEKYRIGIIIDANDPKAMAESVNRFFEDRERYNECKANVKKALEELNWEHEEKKLFSLYNSLSTSNS
jgi:glycosyltransferase involved in cell wall biosynthesis